VKEFSRILLEELLEITQSSVRRSQCSSASIVSAYELDDRAIEVRSPAEAIGFFL
jgi:hypothetical protein